MILEAWLLCGPTATTHQPIALDAAKAIPNVDTVGASLQGQAEPVVTHARDALSPKLADAEDGDTRQETVVLETSLVPSLQKIQYPHLVDLRWRPHRGPGAAVIAETNIASLRASANDDASPSTDAPTRAPGRCGRDRSCHPYQPDANYNPAGWGAGAEHG